MSLPVIFVIDDDAGVLHALRDDLSRRFGEDFRVIGAVVGRRGTGDAARAGRRGTSPWRCSSSTTT